MDGGLGEMTGFLCDCAMFIYSLGPNLIIGPLIACKKFYCNEKSAKYWLMSSIPLVGPWWGLHAYKNS